MNADMMTELGPLVYGPLVLTSEEVSRQHTWQQLEALLNAKADNLKRSLLQQAVHDGYCQKFTIPQEFQCL